MTELLMTTMQEVRGQCSRVRLSTNSQRSRNG